MSINIFRKRPTYVDSAGVIKNLLIDGDAPPKSHASATTEYGAASTSQYGHYKLPNGSATQLLAGDGTTVITPTNTPTDVSPGASLPFTAGGAFTQFGNRDWDLLKSTLRTQVPTGGVNGLTINNVNMSLYKFLAIEYFVGDADRGAMIGFARPTNANLWFRMFHQMDPTTDIYRVYLNLASNQLFINDPRREPGSAQYADIYISRIWGVK